MTKKEQKIVELFDELRKVNEKIAVLKMQCDSFDLELQALIPDNETIAGVTHKVREGKSVSYAKAMAQVKAQLVPKTKYPLLAAIIEENTKPTYSHSIVGAGGDDE